MATITLEELERRLTALSRTRLQEICVAAVTATSRDAANQARQLARQRLTEHTRQLTTSIRHEVETQGDDVVLGRILAGGDWQGLHVPYARLQEYGGDVVPVRARYLTIPVAHGLTSAGTPRYPSVRMMPFALFLRAKSGGKARFLVFDRRNMQLFFVLVERVTVPGVRYLRDAVDAVAPVLVDRLAEAAAAAVGEA